MQDEQPIVWIAQESRRREGNRMVPAYDTQSADRYGTRKIVIPFDVGVWKPKHCEPFIKLAAREFQPASDYLLLMGSPVGMGMVFTAFIDVARETNAEMALLRWSARDQDYEVIEYTPPPADWIRAV